MELIQYYDGGRFTAMSDVYCAAVGTLLGALAGSAIGAEWRCPVLQEVTARPFIALLLTSWIGYRLYPFVPVIDLHKYWDALKPLLFHPRISGLSVCEHTVTWLAIALLLEALLGRARGQWITVLLFPAVLLARVLIDGIVLSPSEVCGGGLALIIWNFWMSRYRGRAVLVAALFAATLVLQGLEPFEFVGVARPFGWVPFRSILQSPINSAVISFFEKVFNYGCLVWLLVRAGCSIRKAAVVGGTLVFGVRLTQIYLAGRSAEITDLVMLLIIAGIMQLLSEDPKGASIFSKAQISTKPLR
jgi:hypothetical protein